MKYFIQFGAGEVRPAGNTAPYYDPILQGWVTAVAVFAALSPSNCTITSEATAPVPVPLALLTPMTLYLAFSPAERIAIKKSTDQMVMEFWATYQLSVQLGTMTDPNLVSVQQGIGYLARPATATPAGPGILASADRVTQILAGVLQ